MKTMSQRRFNVIMTLLLRHVSTGISDVVETLVTGMVNAMVSDE